MKVSHVNEKKEIRFVEIDSMITIYNIQYCVK